MRFTLRQLQVFITTARFQNVTLAAQHLAMSQSAASGALKDLEDKLSLKLFDRVGKRLQANELGRWFRPKAEALLQQAAELEQGLLKQKDFGELRLGATLTIGNYLAPNLMATLMKTTTGAQISLDVANTQQIAQKVVNFELDLGLIEGELVHDKLAVLPWREDELVVFCAPDHPWAKRKSLNDKDLVKANWILRESGSGTRQTFDRALHGLLPKLKIALELQHTEAIKQAVKSGLGVSCLSRITVEEEIAHGSLHPLSVPHRDLNRHFYFILHQEKYRSASIEQWLSLCREFS